MCTGAGGQICVWEPSKGIIKHMRALPLCALVRLEPVAGLGLCCAMLRGVACHQCRGHMALSIAESLAAWHSRAQRRLACGTAPRGPSSAHASIPACVLTSCSLDGPCGQPGAVLCPATPGGLCATNAERIWPSALL